MVTQIAAPRSKITQGEGSPPVADARMGHNRPPLDVEAAADMRDKLDARRFGPNDDMTFEQWAEALVGSSGRAVATDEHTAARCAELERKIGAAITHVNGTHAEAKAPYLAAGRVVDAIKNQFVGPLTDAKSAVNRKSTQFLREEQNRRDTEARRQREAQMAADREAARLAQLEAAQAAPEAEGDAFGLLPPTQPIEAFVAQVAAPEPLQFRSDEGALLSGTRVWVATVTDYELAFMAVAENSKVREAIDKAIASLVKGGLHKIAGVNIRQDIKARSL